jgi:hypothetical protein
MDDWILEIKIDGWDWGEHFAPIDWLEVINSQNGVLIIFHSDGSRWEEDPLQYGEDGKEALRNLLRHLGYQRCSRWEWEPGLGGRVIKE